MFRLIVKQWIKLNKINVFCVLFMWWRQSIENWYKQNNTVIMEEKRFTSNCGRKRQHKRAWLTIDYFEGFSSATLSKRGGGIVENGGEQILSWWFFLQWWWRHCGRVPDYD